MSIDTYLQFSMIIAIIAVMVVISIEAWNYKGKTFETLGNIWFHGLGVIILSGIWIVVLPTTMLFFAVRGIKYIWERRNK